MIVIRIKFNITGFQLFLLVKPCIEDDPYDSPAEKDPKDHQIISSIKYLIRSNLCAITTQIYANTYFLERSPLSELSNRMHNKQKTKQPITIVTKLDKHEYLVFLQHLIIFGRILFTDFGSNNKSQMTCFLHAIKISNQNKFSNST